MRASDPSRPKPRLTLDSRLEELALVWPWVEAIAGQYAVSAQTRYSIHLCLEEALSNIIRHGYKGQAGQPITVDFAATVAEDDGAAELIFTIEDHAPPFEPPASCAASHNLQPASLKELDPGGQGLHLMRKFASRLRWERLRNGNRLTLAFTLPG